MSPLSCLFCLQESYPISISLEGRKLYAMPYRHQQLMSFLILDRLLSHTRSVNINIREKRSSSAPLHVRLFERAGENEGERTEGYGRGTTSWLCFLSSKLRYLNYRTKRGLFKDGNRTQYRRGSETNIDGIEKSGKGSRP